MEPTRWLDIVVGVVERRLARSNDNHKKTVKILGPKNGKVVSEVVATPEKQKR